MVTPKRLKGAVPHYLDERRPWTEWEQPFPPADYVLGPAGEGITYLPPGYRMTWNLASGGSSTRLFRIENPGPADMYIPSLMLHVTKAGSAASSSKGNAIVDIGLVASSSATDSNLGLGIDVATIGIVPVVVGGADQLWAKKGSSSNAWLTGLIQVGGSSLTGRVIIEAVPLYST